MVKDVATIQHDRVIAATVSHACRDRKRQLLTFGDDQIAVAVDALMAAADATVCDVGHDGSFADLRRSGVFEENEAGGSQACARRRRVVDDLRSAITTLVGPPSNVGSTPVRLVAGGIPSARGR